MRLKDLTGQKFGRLTVIERAPNKGKKTMWRCKCDCGNETVVAGGNLTNGHIVSCGCYNDERRIEAHTKHGMSNKKMYATWLSRRRRCYDTRCPAYKNYGGRGITMCDRWRDDFGAFYEDVSKMPHYGEVGYTLERIDNNGNYCPENCCWATAKQQSNNRRSNVMIAYLGRTQTLGQWVEELGLNYKRTRKRIRDLNWSAERAFTTK